MKYHILTIMFVITCGSIFSNGIFSQIQINSIDYYTQDVYNTNFGTEIPLDITVGHSGLAVNFFITISGGGSGSVENRQLKDGTKTTEYFLYTDVQNQTLIKDIAANPTSDEVLSGYFSNNQSQITVSYTYVIPPAEFPATGYYSDSVVVTLYSGTLSNYTQVSQTTIQYAVQVPYEVNLSVVPTGAAFDVNSTAITLDFGVLTSGLERSADIVVLANTPYKLLLTSSNGSRLTRADQWEDSEIPYICSVNGSTVNLPSYQAVEIGQSTPTPAEGDRYELDFVIGDFWDVTTGIFQDTLQISLQSM